MRRLALVVALIALAGCFDFTNTLTGPGGTGSDGSSCSSLVASVNVDIEAGTTGGQGRVGTPLVFSADPRDGSGASLPGACLTSPATFSGGGVCPQPQGSLASFSSTPTAAGTCSVAVVFLGKTGSRSVEVLP